MIDWNDRACALNRDNALLLKKWDGDNSDRALIGLAQLLQGELGKNQLFFKLHIVVMWILRNVWKGS